MVILWARQRNAPRHCVGRNGSPRFEYGIITLCAAAVWQLQPLSSESRVDTLKIEVARRRRADHDRCPDKSDERADAAGGTELSDAIDRIRNDSSITGAVLTSGEPVYSLPGLILRIW